MLKADEKLGLDGQIDLLNKVLADLQKQLRVVQDIDPYDAESRDRRVTAIDKILMQIRWVEGEIASKRSG